MQKILLSPGLGRFVTVYGLSDPAVPPVALAAPAAPPPDLSGLALPLPSAKRAYTCCARTNGALWLGAPNGLTRVASAPAREADRVLYFSADRDLADNAVQAIYAPDPGSEVVWARTATGVSRIELRPVSCAEKAELLYNETRAYVDRHGMVSQKELLAPRAPHTAVRYGESDNSGTFTAGYAVGELCKYAVLRRERGAEAPETLAAKQSAVRAVEACQLLMYIAGRGDGFVARTYLAPDEPVPEDGLFYRIQGDKAVCLDTPFARERGIAGKAVYAGAPVPERLTHLYTDEGYTRDGLVYKGDTSSDEITHHYLLAYFAHTVLGDEDPELDGIVKTSAKNTLRHILKNGNRLLECDGEPTTWAKWDKEYFSSLLGWSDGCLNAAELLMYLRVVMAITGETGEWAAAYDRLVNAEGYAALTALHDARFHVSAGLDGMDQTEELMYGDHMLATCSYWLLAVLEPDETLRELYQKGYRGWNGTFRREHNPGYDIPFMLACPDDPVDTEALCDWFRRTDVTRLGSGVSVSERHDVPKRLRFGGTEETSCLLQPDERAVSKYDRNPYAYLNDHYGRGTHVLESCYVYTFAYWLGRYSGIIEEEEV